ncbi:glucocorticoid modulatory element-binding protein 1-like isoform X2 [Megalops cyprinoides]|uniref:glucocorticoid modulatory element-binding protein 1-like isoform X2 n=1 Tax=Megalops cyprinoides TaxID=118141 RepID=UPI001863A1D6|nr:glucocorticoid modulatory element-binding protein 1-like isoform X2 [Megalops cyprinoides]
MANTEVAVSVGDMVMVKTEEEDPNNSTKTQVILQLQSITQGVCEDTAEMGTAVVAVETHSDGTAEGEEVEYGYPITCGDSKAVLLFKKFVCPGINVKCVKYDDQLISPKQFVHLAGKATLKDWKRAIRLGGVMLRKMMDSGQIDFYQHDTVCTNTCRSTKFDLLINNTRFPPQSSAPPAASSPQENGSQVTVVEDRSEETAPVTMDWSSSTATAAAAAVGTDAEIKTELEDIGTDTLSFWKGIADVGLMGEVVSNIRTQLLALLRGVQLRSGQAALQEPDAAVLNNLAQMFGLLDSVKRALENRRSQTDDSQEEVHSTLSNLERQLEEQKKQTRDWRERSQPSPNDVLMSPSGSSKPQAPKRRRLQRPASSSGLQQDQQFAIFSPITIAAAGQSLGVAQLPAGSQLLSRYALATAGGGKADTATLRPASSLTVLSAAAVSEHGQLGATVSPVELVHLAGEGEEPAGVAAGQREGEAEEEGQVHATVIQIDPGVGDQAAGVLGLRLEGGVGATVLVQGELEEVHEVQMEHQGQLHDAEIVVEEEEAREERQAQ